MGAGELVCALLAPAMVRGASAMPACSLRETGRAEEEILSGRQLGDLPWPLSGVESASRAAVVGEGLGNGSKQPGAVEMLSQIRFLHLVSKRPIHTEI